jgi:hypothetical protein
MIKTDIPGIGIFNLSHLVLYYNGTHAVDGIPIECVKKKLNTLANQFALPLIF